MRISQPRQIPLKGSMGSLASLPFWPPRSFLVRKVSLTARWEICGLISYLDRAQPPLLIVLLLIEFLSTGNKLQLLTLGGPIYLLPQKHLQYVIKQKQTLFQISLTSHAIYCLRIFQVRNTVCVCVCVCVSVAQLYPTHCDPMDCSPPGSSVHGILQARILKWVVIPFSRGSFQIMDRTWVSCTGMRILYCLSHQGSAETLVSLIITSLYFTLNTLFQGSLKWSPFQPSSRPLPLVQNHTSLLDNYSSSLNGLGRPRWC